MAHKFKAGQTVRLHLGPDIGKTRGNFKVVRLLPSEHGINQYRIKSDADGHERVVIESQVS
jgi:hypothetical protein